MLDIYELLRQASEADASDVHISVGVSPRFRVHGEIVTTNFHKMTPSDTLEILLNLMSPDQRERFETDGEIDLSVSIPSAGRYRVNAYKQRGSITIALRLVDMKIPDSSVLKIPENVMALCDANRGLIMITGPAGSGKSTVIASMVERINTTRACNIITIEDPIEYLHSHNMATVNQREIGLDAKDYITALNSALRQDPDVLELKGPENEEEASKIFMAAETGRLVFSSMYTMSATETVMGLLDLYPNERRSQARNKLANSLKATVARQLLIGTDGGRIPAYEIMIVDNKIRQIIRNGDLDELGGYIASHKDENIITMDDSLFKLYSEGKISGKTAVQSANDQEKMKEKVEL
ncbi:MAG: PilT/PilU family type 4a pilus ATPase [Lachnospiraceae bacterium]|nr:PilT/PilU family type 4a pilus ATPase [Lachnospiraceae bacterium]